MTASVTAARWAVTALTVRQVRLGAGVVIVLGAGMTALVAATYPATVAGPREQASLAALAGNPAIRTMFGVPSALDQPGGFAVWRTGTVLAVLLATWAAFATTRICRGEEEAGRADLLLAGVLPAPALLRRQLTVLVTFLGLAGAAVAGALAIAGAGGRGAALHGAGLALIAVFGAGVAAVMAQAFPSRSAASGAALGVLGVCLLLRMVGDGVAELSWLRWLSPFGLVALSDPYATARLLPLGVLAGAAVSVVALAAAGAGRRDVRDGWLATRSTRPPRLHLLTSAAAFAVRRSRRPVAGWAVGLGTYYLIIGLVAVSMTRFLRDNPTFAEEAAQAGFVNLSGPEGYAATLLVLLAMPVGGFVTARLASFAADETAGRLALTYAGPVTRIRAAGAEVLVAAGGAVVLTATAGFALWAGGAAAGNPLSLLPALAGAANVLPIAALSLGAAMLALGWWPRAVSVLGGLPSVGGFLLTTTTELVDPPDWLLWLSPYQHVAPVPAAGPDWAGTTGMTTVALVLTCAGLAGYRRRDQRG